jgi:hypothetical protein
MVFNFVFYQGHFKRTNNSLVHSGNDEHRIEDCVGGQSRPDEPREEDGEGEEDALVLLVLHRRRPVDLTLAAICKKS